jgi:hypothetical protein
VIECSGAEERKPPGVPQKSSKCPLRPSRQQERAYHHLNAIFLFRPFRELHRQSDGELAALARALR